MFIPCSIVFIENGDGQVLTHAQKLEEENKQKMYVYDSMDEKLQK